MLFLLSPLTCSSGWKMRGLEDDAGLLELIWSDL